MIFQHQGHAKAYSFNVSKIHVLEASAPQPLQANNQWLHQLKKYCVKNTFNSLDKKVKMSLSVRLVLEPLWCHWNVIMVLVN
jgi:hypothetical protein